MKKYRLIAAVLFFSALNIVSYSTRPISANNGGGLKCKNVTGCRSNAGCSGSGTISNCNLSCSPEGELIQCPTGP